ncbi:glycosyl hydrolases family 2, TIM barrel domain-containing protein [Aspergillus novoparasiticus]|uniref:beta-galactosidase n=1 Tax=Aspergillus novoparasiticus TaxID=986946 RepID=A0A5N6EY68_9EURO|nr:glycosyl hydrolases family 2, TIM barrel domain-containing protein [Aspergillus novoparasiticus]
MASLATTGWPGALPDWSNLNVLHRNTLAPRAHFYLYPNEEAALTFDREESLFHSLNGTWKFHYDASPFVSPSWDSNVNDWDDIVVPGMWQTQGYGRPHYTNIDYPFPATPPNVSYMNPTGSYWREFEVPSDWDGQQIRLRYEGVDSAFHVYVNGEEVGYSQGSRNPSEFDITEYLSPNDANTLATRVYQWSDGSYLEDQDQWWLSGIFRDVYLIPFPQSAITDFSVMPELDDSLESGTLNVNVTTQGADGDMSIKVLLPNGEVFDSWSGSSSDRYSKRVEGDDLHLWSAETPNLYTILIEFNGRTISQKFGFRRVEMSGSNFLVNGKPIIIYGVNRHEHHYLSGRTVPYEAMRADLIQMKRSNINTIRTAHQPPHPAFFDVADELGFYVIAEADLECHGFIRIEDTEEQAASWLSDNPEWTHAYLDRAQQVVERFKNHVSVIIWSLGNECFYGQNQAAMYQWIKERDPSRIIHYEQDREAESADIYSHMYSSPNTMLEHMANHTDKPLILCEYAHAMGNGPGGLEEYVALFRSEPLSQGGLVWEWNNHGLLKKEGDLEYFAYGGDFGDEPNDADFIMDGLTLSDHTPMPSLLEYAKIIQPVTVRLTEDSSQMIVTNHYDFVDLSGLNVFWHMVYDGRTTNRTELTLPRVPAGENRTVDLPLNTDDVSQEAWLTIEFELKENRIWADQGHIVAWDQLYLRGTPDQRSMAAVERAMSPSARQAGLQVTQDRAKLNITTDGMAFGFDLLQGNVTWEVNGVSMFQQGPELYFYRAMTQNDEASEGDGVEWDAAKVGMMHTQVRGVTWSQSENEVTVHFQIRVAPKVLEWGVEADLIYTVSTGEPTIRVQARGEFVGKNTPSVVPRIGLMAVMSKEFSDVSWFGRGPGENYKDSKQACRMGRYESTVEDLFTYYDYPQENGNREDLRWLQVSNGEVTLDVRRADEGASFSFTAGRYMPFDLNDAKHPHDLNPLNVTVLNLDYDNHGLGSATVGPKPFEKYKCRTEPFDFTFVMSLA